MGGHIYTPADSCPHTHAAAAARLELRRPHDWLCGLKTRLYVSNVPCHMHMSKRKPCARRIHFRRVLTKAPTPAPADKSCILYCGCRDCCLQLLRSCLCCLCCLHCLQHFVKGLQQHYNKSKVSLHTPVAAWPSPAVQTSTRLLGCLKLSIKSVLRSTDHQTPLIQAVLSGS
jgi:hypothetical protein